jgi:hypothetical protein
MAPKLGSSMIEAMVQRHKRDSLGSQLREPLCTG